MDSRFLFTITLALIMGGCGESPKTQPEETPPAPQREQATELDADVAVTVIQQTREALCSRVEALDSATDTLIQTATPESLQNARNQWREAHAAWMRWHLLKTLVDPASEDDRVFHPIDAQPLLPGYLDRVPGYPVSGLVYSEVPLTLSYLRDRHQSTDPYYVTRGFHPLAFMFWGFPADTDQAPTRTAADFQLQGQPESAQLPTKRRRLMAELMADDLHATLANRCPPNALPGWTNTLASMLQDDEGQRAALRQVLEEQLIPLLESWQRHPEGEDNNGMPVWHSAYARSDFQEWSKVIRWANDELWPNIRKTAPLAELSAGLQAIEGRSGPDKETISSLLEQLKTISKTLQAQPPEPASEEAGQ